MGFSRDLPNDIGWRFPNVWYIFDIYLQVWETMVNWWFWGLFAMLLAKVVDFRCFLLIRWVFWVLCWSSAYLYIVFDELLSPFSGVYVVKFTC